MKLKFFIAGAAVVAGLASAVSCQDLSADLTELKGKVASLESTVQALQSKIEAGAVITSVTPTNSGIVIVLSNGNKYEITNGTNGKDGKDGKDGAPGSVVTIGANGNWFIDGVDTGLAAQGKNGAPGEYYVPNAETGKFDKYSWDAEKGEYVKTPTTISFLAPGTITAVYDTTTGTVTLLGVKDETGKVIEGGVVIGGAATAVASIELFDYTKLTAEQFVTVVAGEDVVFVEGLPGAVTFTKDAQVQRPTAAITVKVNPANYELKPEDVVLVNGKGEVFDQVVAKVKKHEDLIVKSTTETGLWDVTFELAEYDKKAFDAATVAGTKKVAFALKAGESTTDFNVAFEMGTYTPLATMAANFALDKDSQTISTYHNRATVPGCQPEYEWTGKPAYKTTTTNVAVGDNRTATINRYPAQVGKEIKVYVPKANKPEEVKAMYITLDIANAIGEGAGDVSEKNAWKSYSYTGLDQVVEGSELTFSINSEAALGDEIGFRVFAVNYDGTYIDPDGTAFYVLVGDGGTSWSTVTTSISTLAEYTAVQSNVSEIELAALPKAKGKYVLNFVNDDAKAPEFCLGIDKTSIKLKNGETWNISGTYDLTKKAKYPFYTWPSTKGTYTKLAKNDLYTIADNKTYSGTITIIDDGTGIVAATMKVYFTKVLPTEVPEGFSVKTGQVQEGVYNCYLVPAVTTAKVFGTMALYEAAVKAGTAAAAATGSMDMFNVFNFPGNDATNFNVGFATSQKDSKGKYTEDLVLTTMGAKGAAGNTVTIPAEIIDNTTAHVTTVSYNYGSISYDACEWNTDGTLKTKKDYKKDLFSFNTVYNCVYNSGFKWDWNWGKDTKGNSLYTTVFAAELAATPAQVVAPATPAVNEAPEIVYEEFASSAGIAVANIDGVSAWDSIYSGTLGKLDGGTIAIIEGALTSDANGVEEYFKTTVASGATMITFAKQSGASNPVSPVASTLTINCNDVYGHLVAIKLPVKVMPRK